MKIHFLGTGGFHSTRGDTSLAFEHRDGIALFDCGEPCARTVRAKNMATDGFSANLRNIFLSHMHFDHVSGLPVLLFELTRYPGQPTGKINLFVPSCANPRILETIDILNMAGASNDRLKSSINLCSLKHGFEARCGDMRVTALSNAGDSGIESYAFLAETGDTRVLYAGDLPHVIDPIVPYLDDLDLLIIESSHVPPTVSAQTLAGKQIRRIVYSHIKPQPDGKEPEWLAELEALLPNANVSVAGDGLVVEV